MAAPPLDPFEALGLPRGATKAQIRAAYRELVARYHPDRHRDNPLQELAAAKLVEINRAYAILSNDGERAAYEATRGARSASPRAPEETTPAVVHHPFMRILRSVGGIAVLLLFLRLMVALARPILALVRGAVYGVAGLVRVSPIFGLVLLMTVGALTSFYLRSRRDLRGKDENR